MKTKIKTCLTALSIFFLCIATHSQTSEVNNREVSNDTNPTIITDWYNRVDISKLNNTSDAYSIVWKGEVAGSMKYHKTIENGKLIIQDTSELKGIVWEKLDVSINLEDMSMNTGDVTVNYPQNKTKMSGNVEWVGQNIQGTYTINQENDIKTIPIDFNPKNRVLGRAAIFALIPALPIKESIEYKIDMFAFSNAEIWHMNLNVIGKKNITWHNKEVEVYQINLTGGKVNNIVYMTTDGSGKLLQIDVVGQDMQVILN
ncbi:hypothetical protein [uncultured Psychroserpens sp.]|uniref:hypothetical protein n=1 Tax=uncultured Psychroserpens sp. TaxID=255436 RepID=UPI00261BFF60|nr:hypothetical protein [uncultured Psychroserpens sp.]